MLDTPKNSLNFCARLSAVSYADLYLRGHRVDTLLRFLVFVRPFRKMFKIVISKINILLR